MITISQNTKFVLDVKTIKENKLATWQDVAFDLGMSYQQLLRIVNGPQPAPLHIRTKRKMRDYINRNQEYL